MERVNVHFTREHSTEYSEEAEGEWYTNAGLAALPGWDQCGA